MKEAYSLFKKAAANLKIGFLKFAALRPKNCILPGAPGTHSVCVCSIHQNMKLMIEGAHLSVATKDSISRIKSYKDIIDMVLCEE